MKFLLTSLAISKQQAPHLVKLVGKEAKDIKLALIENAADGEQGSKDWLAQNRQAIQSHGFNIELVDLKLYKDAQKHAALKEKLASKDVIWCGGGNTYYLRWLLRETGADATIAELVQQGVVYGGGSAGAIVAGPTLRHFEAADNPNAAPTSIYEGLGLTDKVVVPHVDNAKFAAVIHNINDQLKADGYQTAPLTDVQALVVDGDREWVV